MASSDFTFTIKRTALDENYVPAENTRITTNFANLARGESRQENLRSTLRMIDNRFNSLAHWENPRGDRYAVELQIVSVEMSVSPGETADAFPLIEILQTTIVDQPARVSTGSSATTSPPTFATTISAWFCRSI